MYKFQEAEIYLWCGELFDNCKGESEGSQAKDQTTNSVNPSTAKHRRFNKKLGDWLASVMESNRKGIVVAMAAGQVEDNKRHANSLQLERERLAIATHLCIGYIGDLANIGDGFKALAFAMNPSRQ